MTRAGYALAFINGDTSDAPRHRPSNNLHDLTRARVRGSLAIPLMSRLRGRERHLEELIDSWGELSDHRKESYGR
jgi:hypothetical protein